jgi:3-hydroxyacyl-[acyl-carrier-protein] dehydratase
MPGAVPTRVPAGAAEADEGAALSDLSLPLERAAIEAIIPHRDPFLLVDRIVELEPGVSARGEWAITADLPFLAGHFPGNPIVPGVMMVECAAQVGAVCALTHPDHRGKFGVFAGIDDVRFSRIVRPGDLLDVQIVVDRLRGRIGRASAVLTVDGEQAVRGVLTFALLEEAPA